MGRATILVLAVAAAAGLVVLLSIRGSDPGLEPVSPKQAPPIAGARADLPPPASAGEVSEEAAVAAPGTRPTDPALAALDVLFRLSAPRTASTTEDESIGSLFERIPAETGIAVHVPPEVRERYPGGRRLSGASDWDCLVLLAKFANCSVSVEAGAVRLVPGGFDYGSRIEAKLWASAAAVLARETAIREWFDSPERLAALVLTIPERTTIETIDDLRWALIRAAGGDLPLRLPGALADRAPSAVRRQGTVVEILNAALPADAGLVAVATRDGFDLLPSVRAANAAAEAATISRIRGELERAVLSDIPSPIQLRDLAVLVEDATGIPVRVERSQAGFSIEPPATATAAAALDSIRESFPYVGWTVVGETVVVLREAPHPRER